MFKKHLFITSVLILVVASGIVIWRLDLFTTSRNPGGADGTLEEKIVQVPWSMGYALTFSVPSAWNAYYNGDPVLITNLDDLQGSIATVASVSIPESPVTFTDINWTQVDFKLTDGDLLNGAFIDGQRKISGQTVEAIDLDHFSGYVINDIVESGLPNKGDTGGSTYYLRPKVSSPTWNVIVAQQGGGDESFEAQVKDILDSLSFQLLKGSSAS
ncbi:MAG: hypothetical protein V1685_04200 [Parcubacteria group bacterium]